MPILVLGASGATGQHLLQQLLDRGQHVKAIVRNPNSLPPACLRHPNLELIKAAVLDLPEDQLRSHLTGCTAVASCLGHNVSAKGMWGQPRLLCTEATRRCCESIAALSEKDCSGASNQVKFVLMNTVASVNLDRSDETKTMSWGHWTVTTLLRWTIPPFWDNEYAVDYLRSKVGKNHPNITWSIVRPDGLINANEVTPYELHPSPIRDCIFNPGQVSRINVAHFMSELILNDEVWQKYKFGMPVMYNKSV